jgi:hypothetical protein
VREGRNDVMYARKMTKQQQRQKHCSEHTLQSRTGCWTVVSIYHPVVLRCQPATKQHPAAAFISRDVIAHPIAVLTSRKIMTLVAASICQT